MKNKFKIIVIGKDADFNDFIEFYLKKEGFEIKIFEELKSLKLLGKYLNLIIIDSSASPSKGFDICKKIRGNTNYSHIPVFMILEENEMLPDDNSTCTSANILLKPLASNDLISRVKSFFKQNNAMGRSYFNEVIEIGPLKLDSKNFTLFLEGKEIQLPKKEFQILTLLVNNPNEIFSRQKILDSIWGEKVIVIDRTVDVHIRKIREKLGKYSDAIETVKGIGYKFAGF